MSLIGTSGLFQTPCYYHAKLTRLWHSLVSDVNLNSVKINSFTAVVRNNPKVNVNYHFVCYMTGRLCFMNKDIIMFSGKTSLCFQGKY